MDFTTNKERTFSTKTDSEYTEAEIVKHLNKGVKSLAEDGEIIQPFTMNDPRLTNKNCKKIVKVFTANEEGTGFNDCEMDMLCDLAKEYSI